MTVRRVGPSWPARCMRPCAAKGCQLAAQQWLLPPFPFFSLFLFFLPSFFSFFFLIFYSSFNFLSFGGKLANSYQKKFKEN
jgi:hypothetical protein